MTHFQPLVDIVFFVILIAIAIYLIYRHLGGGGGKDIHALNLGKIADRMRGIEYVSSRPISNTGTSWLPLYEEVLANKDIVVYYQEKDTDGIKVEYLVLPMNGDQIRITYHDGYVIKVEMGGQELDRSQMRHRILFAALRMLHEARSANPRQYIE